MLLKNQDGLLPITGSGKTIAVIGQPAGPAGTENEYNGVGSGHVPEFGDIPVVSPEQGITQRAAANGDAVVYADDTATVNAVAAAKAASLAVVFAGDSESEGIDRPNLTLTGGLCERTTCTPQPYDQNALISAVAEANPNTVVVLNTGGPVLMPWQSSIKGLFEARYSGMTLQATTAGGNLAQASIRVTNTGQRAGADVPQMYIEDPASTGEPPRQLKGFSRVSLSPGQSATVHLPLNARALSWWNPSAHAWTVSRGCYTVAIGPNERDMPRSRPSPSTAPAARGRRRQSRSAPDTSSSLSATPPASSWLQSPPPSGGGSAAARYSSSRPVAISRCAAFGPARAWRRWPPDSMSASPSRSGTTAGICSPTGPLAGWPRFATGSSRRSASPTGR